MIVFEQQSETNIYSLIHNGKELENIEVWNESQVYGIYSYVLSAKNAESGENLISLIDSEPDFPNYTRLIVHNWDIKSEIKVLTIYHESKDNYFTIEVSMKDFDFEESEIESLNFITGLKSKEFSIFSSGYDEDEEGDSILKLEFEVKKDKDISFLESIKSSEEKIRKFCESARSKFLETNESAGLFSTFHFPEELKVPCKQYLLYFAQFLRDLGINVTSNLKEKAGKVLFSVIPIDDVEALEKIREALAIYLNLPSSPIVYNDSFAAMRLQQQIENLQHSQRMAVRELQFNEKLLIAQSDTIREKNLIISQQQSVIEQQDKIIEKISSKSIMIDSAEDKEELEEIFDGLKIGESKFLKEQLGIHLNPAKVIKTVVKNTFGKNEKISILDSNEETANKVDVEAREKILSPDEMLKLAEQIYEGLSEEEISEIEQIALDRTNFFGDRKI
jgi:hypothetical protein